MRALIARRSGRNLDATGMNSGIGFNNPDRRTNNFPAGIRPGGKNA
jgi:hypothetical protein